MAVRARPRIVVIDYGMGNLRSVGKALEAHGGRVEISGRAAALGRADGVVLPGVGAFAQAMRRIRSARLADPVRRWVAAGRPFLGICLGYQLLFDESDEFGRHRGLGCFRGRVVSFPRGLTIPHMGWNRLVPAKPTWLLRGLPERSYAYFVHSYFPVPAERAAVAARTHYGVRFACAVERGPVAGVQFHPEKSQRTGARILRNFIAMVRRRA